MVVGLEAKFGGWRDVVIDAPEFFHGAEGNHLLKQIVPVVALATGGLGEPQSPFVHKRVLHVEVIGVVEDSDGITSLSLGDRSRVLIGNSRSTVFCDSSHDECGGEIESESRSENFKESANRRFSHKEGKRNPSLD